MGPELENKAFTEIRPNALLARHETIAGLLAAMLLMPLARHGNILLLLLAIFGGVAVAVSLWLWREADGNRPDYVSIYLSRLVVRPRAYDPLEPDTAYKDLPAFVVRQPDDVESRQEPR